MVWGETLHHFEHFWGLCVSVCVCVCVSHRRPDVLVYLCRFSDLPAVLFWSPAHHKHTLFHTHTTTHSQHLHTHTHTHTWMRWRGLTAEFEFWLISDSLTRDDLRSAKSLSVNELSRIFSSLSPSSLNAIISSFAPRSSPPPPFSCGIFERTLLMYFWLLSSLFSALRWAFETRGREEKFFMLWRSARLESNKQSRFRTAKIKETDAWLTAARSEGGSALKGTRHSLVSGLFDAGRTTLETIVSSPKQ